MAGRKRSHSESRWALLPPAVIRCNATRPDGSRCKREAEAGSVLCDQHGGAAPQVRRRAAERLIMNADQAAQMLVKTMENTELQFGVRAKIAQDLLDREGLIVAQVHQIVPTTERPDHAVLRGGLQRPEHLGVQHAARSDASDRELRSQEP
jgi:hypothetical protein